MAVAVTSEQAFTRQKFELRLGAKWCLDLSLDRIR